jgi:hypothetical protein
MGRNSGKADLRIPRGWERAGDPVKYANGYLQAFKPKDPLAINYCRKCKRTHSWCECSVAGNVCEE